ncbi:Uncharacterised protein [Clostridioides difficile]|nr:Uncharacterised protein [Clostridioides difficile]SJP35711.1 Uncharacterised protein [Clostridioides difficile]SJS95015.1 Uncharacterised protein [Clostridioides difficile]
MINKKLISKKEYVYEFIDNLVQDSYRRIAIGKISKEK